MKTIFFLSLFIPCLHAQDNTLILGKWQNRDSSQVLGLQINRRYLDASMEEQSLHLSMEGRFAFAFQLALPQLVQLRYGEHYLDLYLNPGDTLHLDLPEAWPQDEQVRFSGNLGPDNECYRHFRRAFPQDAEIFHYQTFFKGLERYELHETQMGPMRSLEPNVYAQSLAREAAEQLQILEAYPRVSGHFRRFILAEIEAQALLNRLAYARVYGGKHRPDSSFMAPLYAWSWPDTPSLGNALARTWALSCLRWRTQEQDSDTSFYRRAYELARAARQPLAAWLQAQILLQSLAKQGLSTPIDLYEDFLKTNPYADFDLLLLQARAKVLQRETLRPAPAFSLLDTAGQAHQLDEYLGQVTVLTFWASWCRPCLQELREGQVQEEQWTKEGIRFLHISIDEDAQAWLKTLKQEAYARPHHLRILPFSGVREAYEVWSVPQSYVMDKQGLLHPIRKESELAALLKTLKAK